ncbi:GAF domain-containing protein [Paractinoplanes pyxinae]|uniref:GAF domain-containing protein n=1 Tax=Paractinoplanes pyxinae TaxID=2997416 RepID=UPI002D1E4391|nr:GAF domain-containing protein [Actinoplanes pyxinae]
MRHVYGCSKPRRSAIPALRRWARLRPFTHEIASSFCVTALLTPHDALLIPDASRDPRFAHFPVVAGAPHVKTYAGVPLLSDKGVR